MADDTNQILTNLLETGMWSKKDSLLNYRQVVVNADCVISYIYRLCIKAHMHKQKIGVGDDLRSLTLINYIEFSQKVKTFIDFFSFNNIEMILVYEGKSLEAPLYGLLAARFKRNTQQVSDAIEYLKKQQSYISVVHNHLKYPKLALNLFKLIVNIRKKSGERIKTRQAFYSSYPLMTRLARDFRCPVLTDNGDFIIMDVRAGFVSIDSFWSVYVDASRSPTVAKKNQKTKLVNFYLNRSFLYQHPGLNAPLAMNIFPLTSKDLATEFSSSFKRLKVYDREYQEKDFLKPSDVGNASNKRFLQAANRFESVVTFLSSKTEDMIFGLMRSEATRSRTSIDDDYLWFFYNYAVGYEFKSRLRFVLKYMDEPIELQYIETCLTDRECTAEYLLNLLCCSIGRLASIGYNRYLQYEDLDTKHSAYSMKIRSKSMVMSLLSANRTHKGEKSQSKSNRSKDTVTRYSTASLTLVDRRRGSLFEHEIATSLENAKLSSLRDRVELPKLARGLTAKHDCGQFLQIAFENSNLVAMPHKRETMVSRLLGNDEHCIKTELATILSLYRFAHTTASRDDRYFKTGYSKIINHVETAILNHYLYTSQLLNKQKISDLASLVNLVHKQEFENVMKAKTQDSKTVLQIRHLIELLNAAIEAYLELNSFFDYPLARLNLHLHYNPILIYNLALFSSHNVGNKILH